MKQTVKKIIKKYIPKSILYSYTYMCLDHSFQRSSRSGRLNMIKDILKYCKMHRFIFPNNEVDLNISAASQFQKYAQTFKFNKSIISPYFYPLDATLIRVIPEGKQNIASLTQDYEKILECNLLELRQELTNEVDNFSVSLVKTIDGIDIVRKRAVKYYSRRNKQISGYMERLMYTIPESFDEALQKILFFNALMWASQVQHIGLGRLDLVLLPYLKNDLQNGVLTLQQAKDKVCDFVITLGSQTAYKSLGLIGDTGQVILISGTDKDGRYVQNELTHLFLEVITELNIPDPKLIMRVSERTTSELWQKAIKCMARGNGSPLIANETKIMELMKQFGYQQEDVIDFGTSACWEPLIIGKSFDQNNCAENVNIPLVITKLLAEKKEFESYEAFEAQFLCNLTKECERIAKNAHSIDFDRAPLQSLWLEDCLKNKKDISEGGAKYNYHGFLCAGLPNAVNSLLNIEKFIFEDKKLRLLQLADILANNYKGYEGLKAEFITTNEKFGKPDNKVIELSDRIMDTISRSFELATINGSKVKVGFSSPGYLDYGQLTGATPDGRGNSEPFATHISPVSKDVDFAEIVDFSSKLDYSGNKINGNVLDFILSDQYVKNDDKFAQILRVAFQRGVYEMQLNVLNAEQLIAAKGNPKLYPHLVVRVWGFSAYFNDLPESYKDHLIERALKYKAS